MSYDLMVFDPDVAPRDREEFIAWYRKETEWGEDHSYDDPKVSSQNLRSWFLEMIKEFPALNGPYADEISDNPKQTDYCIGKSVIYSAFNWSPCRDAYRAVFELARKHGVGFYDVSGVEGQVWAPDSKGSYACTHAGREPLTPEEAAEERARIGESLEEFVKWFDRDR